MRKGEDNKYNFSLLSSIISLDVALSNCLLGSKNLEEDYALPIKNPRKRRQRSATPDPKVPTYSNRPSTRLRSKRLTCLTIANSNLGVIKANNNDNDNAFLPNNKDDDDNKNVPAV